MQISISILGCAGQERGQERTIRQNDDVCITGDRIVINRESFVLVPISEGFAAIPTNPTTLPPSHSTISLARPPEAPVEACQRRTGAGRITHEGRAHEGINQAGQNDPATNPKKKRKGTTEVVHADFYEFHGATKKRDMDLLVKSTLQIMRSQPPGFSSNKLKDRPEMFAIFNKRLRPRDIDLACEVLVGEGHLESNNGKNCWILRIEDRP